VFKDGGILQFNMYDLTICAIFKDEALYLKDWINYHTRLGVQYFYLYNNNSSDNFLESIKDFSNVSVYDWPKHPGQVQAYNDCILTKAKSKWLALIDIDEYIVPNKSDSIVEVLKDYETSLVSGLCISWAWFGDNNKEKYEDIPVPVRFDLRYYGHSPHVKSIVRPERIMGAVNPHWCHPLRGKGYYNVDEDFEAANTATPKQEKTRVIQINHYYTKSKEEWALKCAKGRADIREHRGLEGIDIINKSTRREIDTSILRFYK
jgi:hypothetical protein